MGKITYISFLALLLNAACKEHCGFNSEPKVYFFLLSPDAVSFNEDSTSGTVNAIDSASNHNDRITALHTLDGSYHPETIEYQGLTAYHLPLDMNAGSCSYVLSTPEMTDTLTISYAILSRFQSKECGYVMELERTSIVNSKHIVKVPSTIESPDDPTGIVISCSYK